jgi:hypothetical protein
VRTYQLGKGTVLGILAEHGVKMRGGDSRRPGWKLSGSALAACHSRDSPTAWTVAPKLCSRLCLPLECHCKDSGNAARREPCDLEATGNDHSANQGRPECPGRPQFIVEE